MVVSAKLDRASSRLRGRGDCLALQGNLLDTTELFESALLVQGICAGILPVDLTKKPFQFPNFLISNIIPNLERREMCPETRLGRSVPPKSSLDVASFPRTGHSYLHHVVSIGAPIVVVEDIDPPKCLREDLAVFLWLKLDPALHEVKFTCGHVQFSLPSPSGDRGQS